MIITKNKYIHQTGIGVSLFLHYLFVDFFDISHVKENRTMVGGCFIVAGVCSVASKHTTRIHPTAHILCAYVGKVITSINIGCCCVYNRCGCSTT